MNENDYLQQVATQAGLQYCPQQGPWGRKSGSAVGTRDGYVTVIGFSRDRQGARVAILLRFKKVEQPELVKAALKSAAIKKGKLAAAGKDFIRWEWKYSFTKPKPEEVARLVEELRAAIKPATIGFDGRCEHLHVQHHAGADHDEWNADVYLRELPGESAARTESSRQQL